MSGSTLCPPPRWLAVSGAQDLGLNSPLGGGGQADPGRCPPCDVVGGQLGEGLRLSSSSRWWWPSSSPRRRWRSSVGRSSGTPARTSSPSSCPGTCPGTLRVRHPRDSQPGRLALPGGGRTALAYIVSDGLVFLGEAAALLALYAAYVGVVVWGDRWVLARLPCPHHAMRVCPLAVLEHARVLRGYLG